MYTDELPRIAILMLLVLAAFFYQAAATPWRPRADLPRVVVLPAPADGMWVAAAHKTKDTNPATPPLQEQPR